MITAKADKETKVTPEETFKRYLEAFETLDLKQFIPFYHVPCMFITPAGVFTGLDANSISQISDQVVAQAKQQGYSRSEVPGGTDCKMLGADLAQLSGTIRRLNEAGEQIALFGITYTMRNVDGEWKIIVLAVHAPQ